MLLILQIAVGIVLSVIILANLRTILSLLGLAFGALIVLLSVGAVIVLVIWSPAVRSLAEVSLFLVGLFFLFQWIGDRYDVWRRKQLPSGPKR
jgi:hypothetical protein